MKVQIEGALASILRKAFPVKWPCNVIFFHLSKRWNMSGKKVSSKVGCICPFWICSSCNTCPRIDTSTYPAARPVCNFLAKWTSWKYHCSHFWTPLVYFLQRQSEEDSWGQCGQRGQGAGWVYRSYVRQWGWPGPQEGWALQLVRRMSVSRFTRAGRKMKTEEPSGTSGVIMCG